MPKHKLSSSLIEGDERKVLAVIGNVTADVREVALMAGVAEVIRVGRPYKLASREASGASTVMVGNVQVGGAQLVVMAGPCSVEGREAFFEAAEAVLQGGAQILRGGAFKPRTSPYAFQGMGKEGLEILAEARERYGLPVVTEVVSPAHVELVASYVDLLQIGARNMQNFELLKVAAQANKPVLLKRGLAATIEEFLMSAEYILAGGNKVILCERGIRTFEPSTRNTLDLSSIPVIRSLSHLPIVVDPSHGNRAPPLRAVYGLSRGRGGGRRLDDRSPSQSARSSLRRPAKPVSGPVLSIDARRGGHCPPWSEGICPFLVGPSATRPRTYRLPAALCRWPIKANRERSAKPQCNNFFGSSAEGAAYFYLRRDLCSGGPRRGASCRGAG